MPKASRDSLGAKGKTDVYFFDPEQLQLVTDPGSLLYDERVKDPVDDNLVSNLMFAPDNKTSLGIVEPVIGRRNTDTGKIEVVAGRDRVKAAREANRRLKAQGRPLLRVPVWIRRIDDSHIFAQLVSENEHRRGDTPLNRAKKMQRFINLGHDERETAALFRVSESTVRNMLRLLDAPAAVRNALDTGRIAASDAYQLAREEPARAKKKLGELLEAAPRTPGKKQRSDSAARAREILRGPRATPTPSKPAASPTRGGATSPAPPAANGAAPSARFAVSIEERVAESIAAWLERHWPGADARSAAERIRKGEWRQVEGKGGPNGEQPKRRTEKSVGAVDA